MEECSLDLIFFNKRQSICFFWLGAGADFSNSLNKIFVDKAI